MPLTTTERRRLGRVRPALLENVSALMDAAGEQFGFTLAVPDDGGTRSTELQKALYADSLAQGGGKLAYPVASPGHSRHEYGAGFDVHIIAGGSNPDGTGSDDDYRRLADLGESLPGNPGLTAGYYFKARGLATHSDPYHFQLNEPFQTSVDEWAAMNRATGSATLEAVFLIMAVGVGFVSVARVVSGLQSWR